MISPPALLNHVGITVPDIWAAIDWYSEVFGCTRIMGPRVLEPAHRGSPETGDIFGAPFQRAYQAHLLTGNGGGLELFQFVVPATDDADPGVTYQRRGPWHVCFTCQDVERTVSDLIAAGGRQLTPIATFVQGRPWHLVYCEDPWGITLELMSHPYDQVFAGWPQPGMTEPTTWLARDGNSYTSVVQLLDPA
jgi:catechol 2,3-dioxygenase-like lactoylglutathione lyase family enzyme